jgi:hypothetical protein
MSIVEGSPLRGDFRVRRWGIAINGASAILPTVVHARRADSQGGGVQA